MKDMLELEDTPAVWLLALHAYEQTSAVYREARRMMRVMRMMKRGGIVRSRGEHRLTERKNFQQVKTSAGENNHAWRNASRARVLRLSQ
jgi:hypothetical protein